MRERSRSTPHNWFSKWEQQCLAKAKQVSSYPWSCRRAPATKAVAPLPELGHLRGLALQRPSVSAQGHSLRVPFQNAATKLYKESVDAHQ